MSLETDARDSLRAAIGEIYDVDVSPEHFDDVKPSDNEIGAKNGPAWLTTLENAAGKLEERGYTVSTPTLAKAAALREQELTQSSIYLEELCGDADVVRPKLYKFAAIGALSALVGAAAYKFVSRWKLDR